MVVVIDGLDCVFDLWGKSSALKDPGQAGRKDADVADTQNAANRNPDSAHRRSGAAPSLRPVRCRTVSLRSRILAVAFSDRWSGVVMLVFALLGLVLANLPVIGRAFLYFANLHVPVPLTNINLTVSGWAQDGLLTLFFLVVGLDLKRELTTGSLLNPRRAAVPMIAAVGGMLMPMAVYLGVVDLLRTCGDHAVTAEAMGGWAVPTATDIAFSLAVLAIFSKGLPTEIHSFLLTLATMDDLLGILLIAFVFTSVNEWYWFALMVALLLVWAWMCRLRKVPWPLVAVIAVLMWAMTYEAGIHPTLSGVMFGLLVPAKRMHGERQSRARRWSDRLQPYSALIALPLFALFATAIPLGGFGWSVFGQPVMLGILAALLIGKPLGVMAASWLCVHVFRLELAGGLKIRDLIGMACACGIGFTVSFLIASLAFRGGTYIDEARLAVLVGSFLSMIVSAIVLRIQSAHPRERWQTAEEWRQGKKEAEKMVAETAR